MAIVTPSQSWFIGYGLSLQCYVILMSDLANNTYLEVMWSLPDNSARMAGTSSDATLTGNGTSYESVLTIPTLSLSLAGIYICSAMVSSTLPLTTNSEAVMNSSIVTVQSKENNKKILHIFIASTFSCFS